MLALDSDFRVTCKKDGSTGVVCETPAKKKFLDENKNHDNTEKIWLAARGDKLWKRREI